MKSLNIPPKGEVFPLPEKKHLSFIEKYAIKTAAENSQKEKQSIRYEGKIHPSEDAFFKSSPLKNLLRDWQKNPAEGDYCWIINGSFQVERILCESKFRIFYQNYRAYNVYLTEKDAIEIRNELLEFLELKQYERYGLTKQMNLFDDTMHLAVNNS